MSPNKVWGQLYPHCGTFPRLALSTDSFKLGRGRSMDYVIRESDMGSAKWLTAVSKVQCEIIKSGTEVFVRDHSSNGTWLNGKKIGKNNMRPLEHDSELCFSAVNKKVFVFRSMSALRDQFPSQLTDKYTVSKVGTKIKICYPSLVHLT
ncbi:serine/threonine-protein kinase Chk2 [Eurytemora carolleeae]|uniref:serine/threonine-protein kinase Chk2 n=1 Tax=Eurytemora carolleeae TaxID=1294199 RepID=UPI000C77BE04|nr:serine/threonine-protein kinase Chk2 [Eurytemora carolleeae]|eukprot:XP_023327885.1 serine/threonine-protein kinase Chk2-like [Eurytemora affinis]